MTDLATAGPAGLAARARQAGFAALVLQVPFRADEAALARSAEQFGVLWTPMSHFHPGGGGEHGIRLSVSYVAPERIPEGIRRLARFVRAEAGR